MRSITHLLLNENGTESSAYKRRTRWQSADHDRIHYLGLRTVYGPCERRFWVKGELLRAGWRIRRVLRARTDMAVGLDGG